MLIDDAESTKHKMSYLMSKPLSEIEVHKLPAEMRNMCEGLPKIWIEPIDENAQEDGHAEMIPKSTTYINYTSKLSAYSECCKSKVELQKHDRKCFVHV